MSYIIVMQFLSWMFAIMLLLGFAFIKICEWDLKDEKSDTGDFIRMSMEVFIEEYYKRDFSGKVLWLMFWGASMMSVIFMIFEKEDD